MGIHFNDLLYCADIGKLNVRNISNWTIVNFIWMESRKETDPLAGPHVHQDHYYSCIRIPSLCIRNTACQPIVGCADGIEGRIPSFVRVSRAAVPGIPGFRVLIPTSQKPAQRTHPKQYRFHRWNVNGHILLDQFGKTHRAVIQMESGLIKYNWTPKYSIVLV